MTPEQWVADRIVALSTSAGARVYQLKLPQRPTLPAVRVQLIGTPQDQHLRGAGGAFVSRVQVDSFADDTGDAYATVRELADDVKGDGLGASASGVWGYTGVTDDLKIDNVELAVDGTPQYEADELRLLRIRQDYLVHWRAA